ncbi:hypothetical protein ACFL56_03010, partial [Candidatus Margulisiibacteriota bacterium]
MEKKIISSNENLLIFNSTTIDLFDLVQRFTNEKIYAFTMSDSTNIEKKHITYSLDPVYSNKYKT